MKKTLLLLLFPLVSIISCSQVKQTNSPLNLGFEKYEQSRFSGWDNFGNGNYKIAMDSVIVKSGKQSASIEFTQDNSDFKALAFTLPGNYEGRKITLSGYIKTENVTDGYAGLWMRIDPSVAFDNMNARGIKGTTDWQKYEVTLDMNPDRTKQIVVGALLVGKGKMWIDELAVSIDGKDIKGLKPIERKKFPADEDKEFDKGSKVSSISVDKSQLENLKALGLIWGFLKYYHPAVADGKYNWDYELFRILPRIQKAENKKDRDAVLVNWINSLGAFKEGKDKIKAAANIKLMPDLDWITGSGFSNDLASLLLKIKNAKRPEEHYYVGFLPRGAGNPDFRNENSYTDMHFPDPGFRLLTLYRYWNIIQYYFPYKNLIQEDWKNVLIEFIPRLINTKDSTEYTLAVQELIARVHDTHANVWGNKALSDYRGRRYAAVEVTFIEEKPVVTGYYNEKTGKETGLQKGDIITSVNGRPYQDIVKDQLKYRAASNYPTQLRDIGMDFLRARDSVISIEYEREGTKSKMLLKTYPEADINIYRKYQNSDTCFKIVDNKIAYINNGTLKGAFLPGIWKAVEHTKGLIIDGRNYPSNFPIYYLCDYLMPDSRPFFKATIGSIETPGAFYMGQARSAGKKNNNFYKGKVIILLNEVTQSSAEFHAMAYRTHPNAVVIGSTTAGADGNVSQFNLPGGINTMISGIGIYYPDGRETQRVGIVPDIEVKRTIKGIKEGKDELLEKAIELINTPR